MRDFTVMLLKQAKYLAQQCFSGEDGATYCVLKLVLWAKSNCKIKYIATSNLLHEFANPECYSDEPDGSPEFIDRALKTQNYPILVQQTNAGDLKVIDGRHRLYKYYIKNKKSIPAYVIFEQDMPEYALYIPSDDFVEF